MMDGFIRSVIILSLYAGATAAFSCYSCSYTYTGTKVSYECVDEPWNVTQGSPTLPCAAPKKCSIDVTFEADFGRILSAARSCRNPLGVTTGCIAGSSRPSCQLFCDNDLCNKQNSENLRPNNNKNPDDDGGGAAACTVGYILVIMLGAAHLLN